MGSPEDTRELAEAQARTRQCSKPRSRPGSNAPPPAPQGAPAVALTYAVAIAPDDTLAPFSSFGSTSDCTHEERDAKHDELSVLAVTVAPPSPQPHE